MPDGFFLGQYANGLSSQHGHTKAQQLGQVFCIVYFLFLADGLLCGRTLLLRVLANPPSSFGCRRSEIRRPTSGTCVPSAINDKNSQGGLHGDGT
jgi:hypothetical protein